MSLRPTTQLHRHDHGKGRIVCRHCDWFLRTWSGHLQEPGQHATPAHRPVQLQMAQRLTKHRTDLCFSSTSRWPVSLTPVSVSSPQSLILCQFTRSVASPTSSWEKRRWKTTAGRWCSLEWLGSVRMIWADVFYWRTPGPPSWRLASTAHAQEKSPFTTTSCRAPSTYLSKTWFMASLQLMCEDCLLMSLKEMSDKAKCIKNNIWKTDCPPDLTHWLVDKLQIMLFLPFPH